MAFSLIKLKKIKDLGITADDRIQYIFTLKMMVLFVP